LSIFVCNVDVAELRVAVFTKPALLSVVTTSSLCAFMAEITELSVAGAPLSSKFFTLSYNAEIASTLSPEVFSTSSSLDDKVDVAELRVAVFTNPASLNTVLISPFFFLISETRELSVKKSSPSKLETLVVSPEIALVLLATLSADANTEVKDAFALASEYKPADNHFNTVLSSLVRAYLLFNSTIEEFSSILASIKELTTSAVRPSPTSILFTYALSSLYLVSRYAQPLLLLASTIPA